MIHFIYKTTCTVTKKYYVGKHSARKLEDGYLGSGTVIKASCKKYGRENHTREILEYYSSKKNLSAREKEIVNEEMLKDPLCMNIKPGGDGGWPKMTYTKERRHDISMRSREMWADPVIRKKIMEAKIEASRKPSVRKKLSKASKKIWKDPAYRKKHAIQLAEAMSSSTYKENMSKASTKAWNDPALRVRQSRARIKSWKNADDRKIAFAKHINTPEVRKKRGKSVSTTGQKKRVLRAQREIALIQKAQIDFSKAGWREKVQKIIKSTKVYQWMKRNLPDVFRTAFFRMPYLVKH